MPAGDATPDDVTSDDLTPDAATPDDATPDPASSSSNPAAATVARCQQVLAHAWMVRTFVKHSEEAEDFPELMNLARTVFDTARALETRTGDPAAYLHMLRKKIGKLRSAAARFAVDAPKASAHTNFQQAVISMNACVEELERLLAGR